MVDEIRYGGKKEEQPRLDVFDSFRNLFPFPSLGFGPALIRLDPSYSFDLFLLSEKPRSDRVIWKYHQEPYADDYSYTSVDDDEELPACRSPVCVMMRHAKGQKSRKDRSKSIALHGPADSLADLGAIIKHRHNQHHAIRDAPFRGT